ncbi:olfactory receptor 14J1-like [Cinclus cinclus]|uniref:olfactory receptor 14J1-like n=1 Tax=Cinclus cinclus TaxID=127875 RepID=UPI002E1645E6
MEPRVRYDIVMPPGTKRETMVTPMNLMEPKVHCDRSRPHGTKKNILTLWGPMDANLHRDSLEPHGTKGPFGNCKASGNQGSPKVSNIPYRVLPLEFHAKKQQKSNSSSIRHFLLLALADTQQLQLLSFCLFLGISLAALLANSLIISAVACGHHLHTPMFFFLLNLALSDLGSICTTVPKAMHNSLWDTSNISYLACAAQVCLFIFFIGAEFSLLTIMCYDRYVSICKPLHYGTLLGSRACAHMAAAAWPSGFLNALMHTANTFSLPLCQGNALGQFFCEIPQILQLSCSHSYLRELGLLAITVSLASVCFLFIVFSYVQIFRAVLRIPSEQGRHKAFSTCLPHLVVVSLFLSTGIFAYLKPPSISSPSLDLSLSVLYSVVPPALNPLIYSLRNQELKDALRKIIPNAFQKQ